MQKWRITVLNLGSITANLSFLWPQGMPPLEDDIRITAPYLGFLLQDGKRNIVVDTGVSSDFIVDGKAWSGLPAEGGEPFLISELESNGLVPDDIDFVIYTHLHNDHAGNVSLFTKARIIFQSAEWENLLNPLPIQILKKDYNISSIDELRNMKTCMVDGDMELIDGIKLYKTPGHSMGSQSVAVKTERGVVLLVGDLFVLNFMAFPEIGEIMNSDGNTYRIPSADPKAVPATNSLIYDYYAFYRSAQKVKAIAEKDEPGYIIPGHDPSLVSQII